MAQGTDDLDVSLATGSSSSPETYSPSGSNRPKQSQQHYSPPCTTQALPTTMTDYQAGVLSGYYTPPPRRSQQIVATSASAAIPDSSQTQSQDTDAAQHSSVSPIQQGLELGDGSQQQSSHEELQQRMECMWPRHSTEFDRYHDYTPLQGTASDTADGGCSAFASSALQSSSRYGNRASLREWASHSQNQVQQGSWRHFHPSRQSSEQQQQQQPIYYYQSRVGLDVPVPVEEALSSPNATSYASAMDNLKRSHDPVQGNYPDFPPATTSLYQSYNTRTDGLPTSLSLYQSYNTRADGLPTSLSPCSTTLAMGSDVTQMVREDTAPLSEPDMDFKDDLYCTEDMDMLGSPSSVDPSGSKMDEPYAKLIYKAFMSRPSKSMTLQEIYQWFRDNTDKAKGEGKGWQNSIRHNLSMNKAFTKRSAKPAAINSDGSLSLDTSSGADGRKSTEWFLEPTFYTGVESTTRYRKGNSRSKIGNARRVRLGDGAHQSLSRVAAGRKGGFTTAQNRKKVKAEQQHRAARQGQNNGCAAAAPQYHKGAGPEGDYYYQPEYSSTHSHQASNTSSPYQTRFGMSTIRRSAVPSDSRNLGVNNYFQAQDVGTEHVKRSSKIKSEDVNEPATPPGSAMDTPPEDLYFSNKHQAYLPEMMATSHGGYSYQTMTSTGGYEGQQNYTLGDVTAVYEPPSGHQAPLFVDAHEGLSDEDAALLIAGGWGGSGQFPGYRY